MKSSILTSRLPSFLFIAGLCFAASIALWLDDIARQWSPSGLHSELNIIEPSHSPLPPRPLSPEDLEIAKQAWRYFSKNTRPETGWADSVSGFPSTTLWDQGSYLLGVISAAKIGIISCGEAEERVAKNLDSFAEIDLFQDKLPNKAYNTIDLSKTDYQNTVSQEGIGWSALDIARILVAFRVITDHFPNLTPKVSGIVGQWDLSAFAKSGELWGASVIDGETRILQEGRLGYEQYGARSAALWGLDVTGAISASRVLEWKTVEGVRIPTDKRYARSFDAITPILSEPFLLQAFEMGLGREGAALASNVYSAQEARYLNTGVFTMVSEDHLDKAPNFAYSSVYSNGRLWAVVDESGKDWSAMRTVSTKATIGWNAMYDTKYTRDVLGHLSILENDENGWAAGIYENGKQSNAVYTTNTNAIILSAIHYKAFGSFLAANSNSRNSVFPAICN